MEKSEFESEIQKFRLSLRKKASQVHNSRAVRKQVEVVCIELWKLEEALPYE